MHQKKYHKKCEKKHKGKKMEKCRLYTVEVIGFYLFY